MQTERIQEAKKTCKYYRDDISACSFTNLLLEECSKNIINTLYFCLFGVRGNKKSLICYILKMFKKKQDQIYSG